MSDPDIAGSNTSLLETTWYIYRGQLEFRCAYMVRQLRTWSMTNRVVKHLGLVLNI